MSAIALERIWFRYPGSRDWTLRDVSLSLDQGEVVVLIGPNGSGKTTIMKVAAGLYRPAKGRVLQWGRDPWSLDERERFSLRRRIVYVHEKPIMLRGSVLRNVAYPLLIRGLDEEEAISRAEEILRRFDSHHLAERERSELSAGEAQLVSILRAVAAGPDALLLDEPTSFLDMERRRLMARIIRELREEGRSLLVATHDAGLAATVAERGYEVSNGSVRAVEDLGSLSGP